jgi:hypothetical protein
MTYAKILIALAIALVVFLVWKFFFNKKEKFTMKLYRPTFGKIPKNEWDPASVLTAVLPGPVLALEGGDYKEVNVFDKKK